jgi:hypothetical protein
VYGALHTLPFSCSCESNIIYPCRVPRLSNIEIFTLVESSVHIPIDMMLKHTIIYWRSK